MKQIIDNISADIETVSVDSLKVRDRLLEDEKYGIDEVPAVLLLYSSGQHKTYTTRSLDDWFDQLLQNIKEYQQQMTQPPPPPEPIEPPYTSVVGGVPPPPYTPIDEGIPKVLRRKPGNMSDIPASLPSPGRPRTDNSNVTTVLPGGISGGGSGMDGTTAVPELGGVSSAQAAMINEHIKDAEPMIPITSALSIQPGRKEVKKEGLSAAELAKQMAEQREQYDEQLEENRPLM